MSRKLLFTFAIVLLLGVSFTYGIFSVRQQNLPFRVIRYFYQQTNEIFADEKPVQEGYWHVARNHGDAQGMSDEQREAFEKIAALPYLKGYNPAPDVANVTGYDPERAYNGLNLVVSGHGPEAILIDMEGNILHRWHKNFEEIWSETEDLDRDELYKTFWRRAYSFPNGDLLAIFRDFGLVKLDKNSNVIWAYADRVHHDLFVTETGDIYTLSRQRRLNPGLRLQSWHATKPYLEDLVIVLGSDGVEKKRVSLIDCFLNSDYAAMLEHLKDHRNILHANSIEVLDGRWAKRYPMFKKGHLLISFREIHTVAVVDLQNEKVTWAITGKWKYQHEPTLTSSGNILLFDNRGGKNRESRILEIEPFTQKIIWLYESNAEQPFHSVTAGTTYRLPNGNTIITESNQGRAFEVTPAGEIVWEFFNPYRAGDNNELIAALYDVVRLEHDYFNWLQLTDKSN